MSLEELLVQWEQWTELSFLLQNLKIQKIMLTFSTL